jgi:transposase-like protein
MSIISRLPFQDENAAFEYLEKTLWPDGSVCPHCGSVNNATKLRTKPGTNGKRSARIGLWKCNEKECRKQFTVKVGTVFEHGRIPLHKMLQAVYLLCCSKKGISSHQLHRILQIQYKSAWFLAHRIREAMRELHPTEPLGGEGKTVEIDETFIGGLEKNKHRSKRKHVGTGGAGKEAVYSLVERSGRVRSHHVATVRANTLRPIIRAQIDAASVVYHDEGATSKAMGRMFKKHGMVNHSIGEYVRGDVHTNSIENYFSILKRGINGVYHHVSEKHLKRYLAEFDFRYNYRSGLGVDDTARTAEAVKGLAGKRLTYRDPDVTAAE